MAFDFSRFGGLDTGIGTLPTPLMTGMGASDPTSAYLQTGSISAPSAGPGIASVAAPGSFGSILGYGANAFPAAPGAKMGGSGLGFNVGTMQLALGGLQTLGSLWQAWEANKLAKEQFKFQKDFANTNLANSIKSYNTALEDRGRSRAFTEGQSETEAQAYIDGNRLPDRRI